MKSLRDEIEIIVKEKGGQYHLNEKLWLVEPDKLAKAIEERLAELGYVKLSELVLDEEKIYSYFMNWKTFSQISEKQLRHHAQALSTAKGIIKVKEL